jgi:hypothetical protein
VHLYLYVYVFVFVWIVWHKSARQNVSSVNSDSDSDADSDFTAEDAVAAAIAADGDISDSDSTCGDGLGDKPITVSQYNINEHEYIINSIDTLLLGLLRPNSNCSTDADVQADSGLSNTIAYGECICVHVQILIFVCWLLRVV